MAYMLTCVCTIAQTDNFGNPIGDSSAFTVTQVISGGNAPTSAQATTAGTSVGTSISNQIANIFGITLQSWEAGN